jgi:very-short-patch-repair endonuclease
MLVALLPNPGDFAILQSKGWYRIPVSARIRGWPPRWLAFYQPKNFKDQAYRVQYYGEVEKIDEVPRRVLFPNEIESVKADKLYHRIRLKRLERRPEPIPSLRHRRLLFIPTTWDKFERAGQINDLFNDSPLENDLWEEFKQLEFMAERQWRLDVEKKRYFLDFAVFCQKGFLDIETDGDTYHLQKDNVARDNERNNALARMGWRVLRYNGHQIRQQMAEYCLREVKETINTLGGLSDDGFVPRKFYTRGGESAQQLSLFEDQTPYETDFESGMKWNVED